jgi:RNA polymerase-binding transcription factor DksA
MKKATKTKAKSKPAKKSPAKKAVKKKPAAKAKAVAKPKAKAKPVKVKSKAKSKPVAKVKPTAKKAELKPVIQKEKEKAIAKKTAYIPPSKSTISVTNNKMPYNKDDGRKIVRPKPAEVDPNKTRYSDKELEEFREIINKKLEDAKRELTTLQAQLTSANDHGTDDTANTFKMLEDGSDSLAKEEAGQLASRQRKFIEQLENALVRIENKTYGVCRVTGKLIPKERLRAVPHTTQSIEAKLNQYRD